MNQPKTRVHTTEFSKTKQNKKTLSPIIRTGDVQV